MRTSSIVDCITASSDAGIVAAKVVKGLIKVRITNGAGNNARFSSAGSATDSRKLSSI